WALGLSFALAAAAPGFAAEPEVMDLEEAAAFLRATPETVKALAESQRIPARRVGEAWRFSRPALLEWLKGEELSSIRGRQAPATRGSAAASCFRRATTRRSSSLASAICTA